MFPKHRQAGITLAEVLVAIGLLFIGVFAVVRVFPAGLRTVETTTARAIAMRVAEKRLEFFQNQITVTDFLTGGVQSLLIPDATAFVALDTNNNPPTLLYLNDLQPDMLPEEGRINLPTGCPPNDPYDPLCNAMTAWKRIVGETHVVQAFTRIDSNGNPALLGGVLLGHAPVYFREDSNTPTIPEAADVLNPKFYREIPANPDVSSAGMLNFTSNEAGKIFKVSYRWQDNGTPPVIHGVSEEMFQVPNAAPYDYTVAARVNNTTNWQTFVPGSVHVVEVQPVPFNIVPIIQEPNGQLIRTESVGLFIFPPTEIGKPVKVDYTIHVTAASGGNYLNSWRVIFEEYKLQPDNQCIDQGSAHFQTQGKTQLLFKNVDDTTRAYFLRREGSRISFALDTTNTPGIPGNELRSGASQVMLDPSDVTDSTLLFGALLNGGCPNSLPPPPIIQPIVRTTLESLHDWSNWTEVASKTYIPQCPRDPSSLASCPAPTQINQDYREYFENRFPPQNSPALPYTHLYFRPSEVGKTVSVDYVWLNNVGQPQVTTGETHVISDLSGLFGFPMNRPFVSILEVRGVSVKAHVSWNSGNKYRQIITAGARLPLQDVKQ